MKAFVVLCLVALQLTTVSCVCTGWTCRNGQCLTFYSDYCDGITDCSDGSDERDCGSCRNGFECDSGFPRCTSFVSDRCDGISECSDGSDEENCAITSLISLIVGVSIAGFIVVVVIPIAICVGIICCVFCCAAGAGAAASSAGRSNVRTTHVVAQPAHHVAVVGTTQQQTGYTPMQNVAQNPPGYGEKTGYQPQGAYPAAYPQPGGAYPPQTGYAPYPQGQDPAYPPQ